MAGMEGMAITPEEARLEDIRLKVQKLWAEVGELKKQAHYPRCVPTEGLVLEWVARDRREKRRRRREGIVFGVIIVVVVVFFVWGVGSAIMEAAALWA